ncbi:MAG: transcription elongation factor GreA [Chloroflexi bacterium]|nr:transcription elongation factor GreA [Chloroflexota bacterium]
MAEGAEVPLLQAVASYLESQAAQARQAAQQELSRFVRWCGADTATISLTPTVVEEYCGTLEGRGADGGERLTVTKGFLTYLYRQKLTGVNLAPHARLRRTAKRSSSAGQAPRPTTVTQLTADGLQQLKSELEALKAERITVVEDIRKAAATKDFTENAPLDAAREKQGQVETRIKVLEATLEGAVLLEESMANGGNSSRIALGSRVVLRHAQTSREVSYLLVEPQEADPSAGKLSVASPVGKAVLERTVGDEVEVATPGGAVQYVVAKVIGSSKKRR